MSTIAVGSIVNIEFVFYDESGLVNPDSVSGDFFLRSGDTYPGSPTGTFTPNHMGLGVYEYNWTAVAGIYKFTLTGTFAGQDDVVVSKYVSVGDNELETLTDAVIVTMLGELDPLYIDPEEILYYYPDADLVEVTEIIWRKSLELESRVGQTNLTCVTTLQHDWILAATMCELSRRYGLVNSGLSGFSSADSFKLGDLQVDRGSGSGSNGNYDVGNAGSWCELAAALKDQLSGSGDTYTPVVPGANFCSPIPSRRIGCK